MYAIVYKSDGFPICRQVPGVSPDPVDTWNTEAAAKAIISSKGGDGVDSCRRSHDVPWKR